MTELRCCDFDDFVKALADETRQRILILLQSGEMSVSELTEHFTTTQPTISHHLAILSRAKLVSARQVGRQVYYHANPACGIEGCGEILRQFKIL
jgi:DNA-binding transcriptional ArsR family regulator